MNLRVIAEKAQKLAALRKPEAPPGATGNEKPIEIETLEYSIERLKDLRKALVDQLNENS